MPQTVMVLMLDIFGPPPDIAAGRASQRKTFSHADHEYSREEERVIQKRLSDLGYYG